MAEPTLHAMHIAMAEKGKQAALAHRHDEALRLYRDAIRLAVSAKAPEVFFRHYSQCVMESLEHTGQLNEVAHFCREADAHYRGLGMDSPLHRKDHGSLLERLGAVLLKQGDVPAARQALEQATALAGKGVLPLAEQLQGWLARGLSCTPAQVLQAQRRHQYFVVRPGAVNEALARVAPAALPKGLNPQAAFV
jgi:hypothetical protein